jgi:uncharacterized protein YndB with AHSA1/START domain
MLEGSDAMSEKLILRKELLVSATPERIWAAFTDPAETQKFMFGCKATTDWKVGSMLQWIGARDGKVYVEGRIVEIVPGKILKYTTIDPGSALAETETDKLLVEVELRPAGDQTRILLSYGNFAEVSDSEKRYHDADKGWDYALGGLKQLVENEVTI